MAPKGVSNRTLLAKKKGIKMGQTIVVTYREEGKGVQKTYEGVLSDRRIGGTDRESYLELRKCVLLGSAQEVLAHEGSKRFVDAFIDDIDVTEPRAEPEPQAPAGGAVPGMGMGFPMAAAGAGMGMLPLGLGGMGLGMGMMPNAMSPGMRMMSMMPMGPMGMGMAMMPMGAMAMGIRSMMAAGTGMGPAIGNADAAPAARGASPPTSLAAAAAQLAARSSRALAASSEQPEDVIATLEGINEGSLVQVAYTHPQLGKTTYEGILAEKYSGTSRLQSYIQLSDSKRIGSRGHVREREASKRLMCAFIDDVKALRRKDSRSRSRSRSLSRRRSPERGRRRSPTHL